MTTISPAIRAELDCTPAWWDGQYQALVRKQIPRAAAYHEDHEIDEQRTYASAAVARWCIECGVPIDDYEEEA